MRKSLLIIMMSCQILFLTGCWGAKEIQSQTYITAIGLDFEEGEFIVYIQALNFANIAKQEGASSLQEASPIFIGEGKGESIQAALSKLEKKVALPLYHGHIDTILLSENVIKDHIKSVIEFIGQNSFIRYNCWLFGTEHDIKSIFTSESFFNYPSIYTVLHNPDLLIKNNIGIPIVKYNKFISTYYQPIGTQIIPSLEINPENFSEDNKQKNIAEITGGYVTSLQQYKGLVNKEDLIGLKWISTEATNIPLSLFEEKVSVIIQKPKKLIKVINGKNPIYHLKVKADAVIIQNVEEISIDKITKEIERQVKQELLTTIEKSEMIDADLLNISEKAYRYHLKKWDVNSLKSLNKESIGYIEVKINIEQNINYKR